MNARAQIGLISRSTRALVFAGTVSDPVLGKGGLLAEAHLGTGGFVGTATFVNSSGSLSGALHITAIQIKGPLVHLRMTAAVTAGTGAFRGAHGMLAGGATVTAAQGVGPARLAGTLGGATGRAPAAAPHVTRRVAGRFQGTSVSLDRRGVETIVGSVIGVVPGPAVVVLRARTTGVRLHSRFTLFAAGGSLVGTIDLRLGSGSGRVRTDTGTASVTGGAGLFRGARSSSAAIIRGTRNLVSQLISLRINGVLRL